MELALRLTSEQDARSRGSGPAPSESPITDLEDPPPPSAAPAGPAIAAVRERQPGADPQTASLIDGLERAAERLRSQIGERDGDGLKASAVPEPVSPAAQSLISLEPRRDRRAVASTAWLGSALSRVAAADRDLGAAALIALLPAQAARSRRDLAYDLALLGSGTWRVRLEAGIATVTPLIGASADQRARGLDGRPDFVVSGPLEAIVPLVAGGAPRRLRGALVTGRKRRLIRLLRDLRSPLGLDDQAAVDHPADAGILLGLLAGAVDREITGEHRFEVAYEVAGPLGGTWRVGVGEGLQVVSGAAAEPASATVHVRDSAVASLLAGMPLPPGESAQVAGSVDAVTRLHSWFDVAQGLA